MSPRWSFAIAALLVAVPATACGPDFPDALLEHRATTLDELPEGIFTDAASRLVAAPGHFVPADRAEWIWTPAPPTREQIEQGLLGDAAARAVAIRLRVNATLAYAAGAGLPEDARRYLAGAAAFAHGDRAEAARRFASVLELAPAERTRYAVWAAYMQGRSLADADPAAAAKAFAEVRTLVAAGAADPLGLAADSFGEEARLRLAGHDDAAAIALYAAQAALGSQFGIASLLQVARAIVADPARLERSVDDPLSQRLVATYLMTRSGELDRDPADHDDDDSDSDSDGTSKTDAAADAGTAKSDDAIARFIAAVDRRGLARLDDAGRLAGLAYRSGRYELAAKFAGKGDDGEAAWVRAKLALRAGRLDDAAKAYAAAAKAFPPARDFAIDTGDPGQPSVDARCRVEGEAGTLALARGEYLQAMEHLYAAAPAFWTDTAHVAERVLTTDELLGFVRDHAAQPAPVKPQGEDADLFVVSPPRQLRALLARRLLREGRYADALAYFDEPALRADAVAFIAARRTAEQGDRVDRATGWYAAALLARSDGMDLLGYELGPDGRIWGGNYEMSDAAMTPAADAPSARDAQPAGKAPQLPFAVGPDAGEKSRFAATVAQPDKRFHYRYLAADYAARAADLLPVRSQAYAATLCSATGFLLARDPDAARVYYDRYVAHGPHLAWAAQFGNACPAPDFAAAAARLHAERMAALRHELRRAMPWILAGAGLVALVGVLLWRRRRAR